MEPGETGSAQRERVVDKPKCCRLVETGRGTTINKGRAMAECSSDRVTGPLTAKGSRRAVGAHLEKEEKQSCVARKLATIRKFPAAPL